MSDTEKGAAEVVEEDEGKDKDHVWGSDGSRRSTTPPLEMRESTTDAPPWDPRVPYKYLPEVKGDSWEEVMDAVNKYDKDLCEGWSRDIDSTLIFAGLFSATVTAFVVDSYKWLSEDSTDTTVRLLAQLSQHLGTADVSVANFPPFTVTADAVRINIFWILSLIITLSAALVGILCKQWIREYQRDTPVANFKAFELRQLRHQSWEYWRVPDIISSTSLLLQLALLLFFVGIIDLLWSRVHVKIVAAVITVAVGISVLFILVTIALPVYYDLFCIVLRRSNDVEWNNLMPCAYRSPLSRVLLSLSRSLTSRHWNRYHWLSRDDKFRATSDWSSVDLHLLRHYKRMTSLNVNSPSDDYLHRGMKWAVRTLGDNVVTMKHIFHCMESLPPVINTLAPYALDFAPPKNFGLRNNQGILYIRNFYGSGTMAVTYHTSTSRRHYAPDPRIDSVHARMVSSMVHEVPGNHLTGLPRDLYLHLISLSRRFMHDSVTLEAILLYWLPLLALSWVNDDEAIRSEGTRWASDIASAAPARMCSPILDSLGLIISPRYEDKRGEITLPAETRRRIISSDPFRVLFTWAGSHWPNAWRMGPFGSWFDQVHLPEYDHNLMKSKALSFANLPINHFDTAQEGLTAQKPEQHSLPFPSARSMSLPDQDTVVAYGPLVEDAKSRIFHESPVIPRYQSDHAGTRGPSVREDTLTIVGNLSPETLFLNNNSESSVVGLSDRDRGSRGATGLDEFPTASTAHSPRLERQRTPNI